MANSRITGVGYARRIGFLGVGVDRVSPFVAPVGGEALFLSGELTNTGNTRDRVDIAGVVANKPTSAFTVYLEVKPYTTANEECMVADWTHGTNTGGRWGFFRSGTQYRFAISFGTAGNDTRVTATAGTAAVDTWACLAGVYNGTNPLQLWQDDVQLSPTLGGAPQTPLLALTSQPITIGRWTNFGATVRPFIGAIRNFRLYNRALSGAEIAAIRAGNPPTSGLVACCPFDGNTNETTGISSTTTYGTPSYITSRLITTSAPTVGSYRIQFIGDSLTEMDISPRREFYRYLRGYFNRNISLVGHTSTADIAPLMLDGQTSHSGVFGQSAAAQRSLVAGWASAALPNLIILGQGTNDAATATPAATSAGYIQEEAINALSASPGSRLVLVTLPPNSAAYAATTDAIAALMPTVAANIRAAGYTVVEANPRTVLTTFDLTDTVHPNRAGYAKWARVTAFAAARAMGIIT